MQTKEKISAFQFFTMLFISRALTTVTYLSSYTKDVRLSDMLVQPVFKITLGIITMIPLYLIYKKSYPPCVYFKDDSLRFVIPP